MRTRALYLLHPVFGSGTKLFLGARKETSGIGDLYGNNKKPLFNVKMQIKFDKDENFTGVQQGKKLISVDDWNKKNTI